jgi:hypothetical protein
VVENSSKVDVSRGESVSLLHHVAHLYILIIAKGGGGEGRWIYVPHKDSGSDRIGSVEPLLGNSAAQGTPQSLSILLELE